MKKITIELDDKYASVLTVTAVGCSPIEANVSTFAVDIGKHKRIIIDDNGKAVFCDE